MAKTAPVSSRPRDGVGRFATWLLLGLAALFAVAATFTAWQRGPWLDEFWSLHLGDPALPPWTLLTERWLIDPHPLLAFVLYRASRLGGIEDVQLARLVLNLPAFALFVAGTLAFTKGARTDRTFYPVFAILLIGSLATMRGFVDLRAYFWLLCLSGLALQYLRLTLLDPVEGEKPPSRALDGFGLATVGVSILIHYAAGLLLSVCYSLFVIVLWKAGRRAAAKRLAIVLTAAWTLMLLNAAVQLPRVGQAFDVDWLRVDTLEAMRIAIGLQIRTFATNPVALALAVLGLAGLARWRAWPDAFTLTVVAALVVGTVGILLLNAVRPMAAARYLQPWTAMGTAVVAQLALPWLGSRLLLSATAAAAAAATLFQSLRLDEPNWNAGLAIVREASAACPGTRTVAASSWRFTPYRDGKVAARERVVAFEGQAHLARQAGLRPIWLDNTTPVSLAAEGACPTLVWVEHAASYALLGHVDGPGPIALLASGRLTVSPGNRVTQFATGTGTVFRIERIEAPVPDPG